MLCHTTEAESRINEEMSAYISEEFKITNIKVANYAEIHLLKIVIAGLNQKFLLAYDDEEW
jgi:RNA binding exosome subunit